MYNKIIYPIIIILFSILFIYGILLKNENIKFNNKIENFLNEASDNLGNNLLSNTEFTKDFINGSWTTLTTSVDSDYNVSNLMEVNIDNYDKDRKNYGFITIDNIKYNVTYLSNENMVCVVDNENNNSNNKDSSIHIKLINKFNENDTKIEQGLPYQNNIPKCIITQYIGNILLFNYVSYKVYNNKVNSELYRIILSGNYYVGKLPPIYNYNVYNKIVNNYDYPSNYISIDNFINDNSRYQNIINKLRDKYNGNLRFCIQRVFYTPSYGNTEIITRLSPTIMLKVLDEDKIAKKLRIVSFEEDKKSNNLNNFFRPKATILYFYKFTKSTDRYDYAEKQLILPASFLLLSQKNNATNMFNNPTLSYDNVPSVEKIITNDYTLTMVNRMDSDMNNNTFFNFSDLYYLI
jgi:hypothetical protein